MHRTLLKAYFSRAIGQVCVLIAFLAWAAVGEDSAYVSQAEFENLARRVQRLETLLQQQQDLIKKQRETIEQQRAELERLRAGAAEAPSAKTAAVEKAASALQKAEFGLGVTTVIQGARGGDDSWLNSEGDRTDASWSGDLEVTIPLEEQDGTFYAHLEAGNGTGLADKIETLTGLNADALDDDAVRVSELWYEQRFFDQRCALTIGKIDLTGAFDANAVANDETTQFLSDALVNNITVPFPDYTVGAELWISLGDRLDLGFGFGDGDSDWDQIVDDNLFSIGEIDLHTSIGGRPGNWRFYAWNDASDYTEVLDPNKTDHNHGWGVSFDQEIMDGCTAFVRFGHQREEVADVEFSWSTGLQLSAAPLGRENDVFGIGFVSAMLGDDAEDARRAAGGDPEDEYHVEAYYNWQVNDVLTLSPDLQWVKNPNGDEDNDDVWVFGVRAQLSF